eukprot:2499887-Pyramimonas_sp.AAC.1
MVPEGALGGAVVPDPPAPIWACDLRDSAGAQCDRTFTTRRAMLARQRFSKAEGHNCRSIAHSMTMANERAFCRQSFRTGRIAQERAVSAALRNGRPPRATPFGHA